MAAGTSEAPEIEEAEEEDIVVLLFDFFSFLAAGEATVLDLDFFSFASILTNAQSRIS